MKTAYVIEDFLEKDLFEGMVALFKFQIPFLEKEKNHWYRDRDMYVNEAFDLMTRPSNYYIRLIDKMLDKEFIKRMCKQLKREDIDVGEVSIYSYVIPPGSCVERTNIIDRFGENRLCMILFTHELWNPEWYSDCILYNDSKNTIIHCEPNKLICFMTNDVIEYYMGNNSECYHCSIVCSVNVVKHNQ